MCRPDYYGIFYEINPWMHINEPINRSLCIKQWQNLHDTIVNLGVTVKLIEPVLGLPDMVFTANAGLVHQNQVWISSFKNSERQSESTYFKDWFIQAGYEVMNESLDLEVPIAFEGAGDALFVNNHLALGFGFRSDPRIESYAFFKQFKSVFCELINPYFYHLDTCFCPLNSSLALWYPGAFSQSSQQMMRKMCQLISVPEREAKRFACNAVVIGQNVILPTGCQETCKTLKTHGFNVYECDMSEFMKSGGACKCLTLEVL